MYFIQTLYMNTTKDPFCDSFGWIAPEYHLMGWALSCLQLHKLYGSITLYANSPAAGLLLDTLQLPFNSLILVHDQLTLPHPDLWALPKIYTYSLQEKPFLHVDGDVFLFEPLDSGLLDSDLVAQNKEVATEHYYFPAQKALMCHFSFFPPCVKKDFESGKPIHACNAGILGGNNISFYRDYTALTLTQCPQDIESTVFQNDFEMFYSQLISYLKANNALEYVCERDLAAIYWCRDLFADMSGILDKVIVRSPKMEIIGSSFNWAGLFNKHYRVGAGYYSDLKITKGHFLNLIVPEATDNGFSLYDINELDHALLQLLSESLSIHDILFKMQIYFDDDVLQYHFEGYKDVILSSIKELVIKKAIQPTYKL